MAEKPQDRAYEIKQQRDRSRDWMENWFYPEWETVWKSYKCVRDPEPDDNGHFSAQLARTKLYDANGYALRDSRSNHDSISMPDTWAMARRLVSRTTAQIPNLKFRGEDSSRADRVSRKCMRDWDKGGVQRQQKKHVTQAALFGWSVRGWYWEENTITRLKRVDPGDERNFAAIQEMYKSDWQQLMEEFNGDQIAAMAKLVATRGRGDYLSVNSTYTGYVGPRAEFIMVADCFPEPEFTSIQASKWFIVERRRTEEWLKKVAGAYPEELGPNIEKLLKDRPSGTDDSGRSSQDHKNLRTRMIETLGRAVESSTNRSQQSVTPEWKIIERHTPGPNPKLAYVTEDGDWIGEIPYPYDLEGRIGFTETVLIDDLLSGVGDATARVLRGLQLLHDRQVNVRTELAYNVARPLVGTTHRPFLDEPNLLKRHHGMRIVHMPQPGALWVVGEQAAMASIVASLQDAGDIERQLQKGSGENNMSMAANVDPNQGRTATGARIMAFTSDILARDGIDMFNETCIKPDAEMLFLLNRSEMPSKIRFDGAPYYRSYSSRPAPQQDFIEVSPLDFQEDFEVEPEVGSTLADDDEAKIHKAQTLNQLFRGAPNVNQDKLRDYTLITLGEGGHIEEWVPKQQGPPPPPQAEPPRTNISITVPFQLLPPAAQQAIAQKIVSGEGNIQMEMPPGGAGVPPRPPAVPGAPAGPIPAAAPPISTPEPTPTGASSGLAATGNNPMRPGK